MSASIKIKRLLDLGCSSKCKAHLSICSTLLLEHEQAMHRGRGLLTREGFLLLKSVLEEDAPDGAGAFPARPSTDRGTLPRWDAARRQLWLGSLLVKEFRHSAPNQMAILAAFQAGGWENGHVENPIPKENWEDNEVARQRLLQTIKNLNRAVLPNTIRFRINGMCTGVLCDVLVHQSRKSA